MFRPESHASAESIEWDNIFFDPATSHMEMLICDAVAAGELTQAEAQQCRKKGETDPSSSEEDTNETEIMRETRKLGRLRLDPLNVSHYARRVRPVAPAPASMTADWHKWGEAMYDPNDPDSLDPASVAKWYESTPAVTQPAPTQRRLYHHRCSCPHCNHGNPRLQNHWNRHPRSVSNPRRAFTAASLCRRSP